MLKVRIPVYYDYASSLSYIAARVMERLDGQIDATLLWKGVQIVRRHQGWKNGEVIDTGSKGKIIRVSRETGIPLRIPPTWLDSTYALEAAEFAKDQQGFLLFHNAVFRAAFEDERDIADLDVVLDIARSVGLPSSELRLLLQSGALTHRVLATEREADSFGIIGYPTFLLGDFPLIGIQPADTMQLLLTRYIHKSQKTPGH